MKDCSADFRNHLQQGVTTICTCIAITRRDGQAFFFTDHDEPVIVTGSTYLPYNSFSRTSITSTLELEVDQMEIHGILNSSAVAHADIASGAFDYAATRVFTVNYEDPDMGAVTLRTGWLGEITTQEDGTFTAEVRGLSQAYAYRIGEAYTPECRADLGDNRCKVPILINEDQSRWKPETRYLKGVSVLGLVDGAHSYRNLSFINPSFDDDGYQTLIRSPTGWTTQGDSRGRWTIRDNFYNTTAKQGGYALFNTDDGSRQVADLAIYQDIDLIAQGVDAAALDTGLCRLYLTLWHAQVNGHVGPTRLQIVALDRKAGQVIAGTSPNGFFDTGQMTSAEDQFVQLIKKDIVVPAGARALRFTLSASKKSKWEEGGAFDTITAAINDPNGTFGSSNQYGDVVFQSQTAGTSGATEPTWSNALNDTTQDNGIVWKALNSYKTVSTVEHAGANGKTLVPAYVEDADGYYDGGLITWETGKNAGRSQEIKTWAGGLLTLFYRPYYAIKADDRFILTPGCDKTRATCSSKFHNIINFRGEPDVPGQDKYYTGPNAPTDD